MFDLVFLPSLKSSDLNEYLNELKLTAKKLGTEEVIASKNFRKDEFKEISLLLDKFRDNSFSFKTCHLLEKPDSQETKKFSQIADFVAVKGKNISLNKFAVQTKQVDFLLHPLTTGKPEFDTAIAREASQNKVGIAFLFSEFLSLHGFRRSMMLKNCLFVSKLMQKFKANAFFFSGGGEISEMRSPEDMLSFGALFSFTKLQLKGFQDKLPK